MDDIRVPLWNKLLTYVGVSPTIVARVDFGQAAASPELRRLAWEATEEAAAVARAEGVNLAPGAGDRVLTVPGQFQSEKPALAAILAAGSRGGPASGTGRPHRRDCAQGHPSRHSDSRDPRLLYDAQAV